MRRLKPLKFLLSTASTLSAVAVLSAVAAGCGSGDDPEFTEIPPGARVVDQDGLKFRPDDLVAQSGESVYFTNSERAPHTVTVDGRNQSGNMVWGAVFVWTFDEPGEYRVTCDYHPKMRATVTVE